MRCGGTTRFQVVDQRLTDLVGQGQTQGHARFRLCDFDGRRLPLKLIECQRANIARPQSQPACQEENGVISFPFRRTAVDRRQQPDDELLIPHRRDCGIRGHTDFGQLPTEILRQNSPHRQKPEKRTQVRDNSRDRLRLQVIPTRHELREIQRLYVVQRPRVPCMQKI